MFGHGPILLGFSTCAGGALNLTLAIVPDRFRGREDEGLREGLRPVLSQSGSGDE
jgi:hypothetical protein